jgi:hypothetical protein
VAHSRERSPPSPPPGTLTRILLAIALFSACSTTRYSEPLEDARLSVTGVGTASGKVAVGASFSLAGTVARDSKPAIRDRYAEPEGPKRPFYWQLKGDFVRQVLPSHGTASDDIGWAGSFELRGGMEAWKNDRNVMASCESGDDELEIVRDCQANL